MHSLDREKAVLGQVLAKPETMFDLEDSLTVDDFYATEHKWIFEAMQDLYYIKQEANFLAVSERLNQKGYMRDIVGGEGYLASLTDYSFRAFDLEKLCCDLRGYTARRRMTAVALEIAKLAKNPDMSTEQALDKAENLVLDIANGRRKGLRHISDVLGDYIENLKDEKQARYISTGFPSLDSILGGWRSPKFVVIGARPAMGKSAFAMNCVLAAAERGFKVAMFSMEMDESDISERYLAFYSLINSRAIRLGMLSGQWDKIDRIRSESMKLPFYLDDSADMDIAEIKSRCKAMKAQDGLDLVVLDYMQLLNGDSSDSEGRYNLVSKQSRALKKLAKTLGVPVLALSQLNRKLEERSDKRPQLADLRDSGSIEQDADDVLFLYRHEYYNPNCDESDRGKVDVIVAKQRGGCTGQTKIQFQPEYSRFLDE